uniref:Small ribosomal subunit protein bS16c n=2 Tax=Anthoceros angustus TaxID=48387 RepID=RR16_ANTAG|nr:ribosomal protein S16 [Anthoceros angustus]Q85CF2.1 RecName: Full=Small ribosomal subunit protein bS16c; AltName: Full=30S ribosomal protein S16, chloroplastic [Anthoceros angustus]BAC55339.1 ribosomal protein S16 [Anthoceros angustus]BAC55430.1 ribosomal protein S16 [Anthoceros angustus]
MVKLRLKRYGRKQQNTYRIVAIDAQSRREGRALEEVGFYNLRKDQTQLDILAIVNLIREGAQPTETVYDILRKAGIFERIKANP